jgi:hypothetical protein
MLAACVWLGGAEWSRADDQAEAMKIIGKAVEAAGGEAKLSKWKGATWKIKGDFHGMGTAIPYTGNYAMLWPNKSRFELEFDAGGMQIKFAMIYNGTKGWRKFNDMAMEMDDEQLQEAKQNMHVAQVTRLISLKDKGYTLSLLGESKVNDKPAVGVKVASKGFRDVNLYFDRETGQLIKSEYRTKDMGQEASQETYYTAFKDVDGLKYPSKVTIKRDGQLYVESEASDYKPVEKLDDALFAMP